MNTFLSNIINIEKRKNTNNVYLNNSFSYDEIFNDVSFSIFNITYSIDKNYYSFLIKTKFSKNNYNFLSSINNIDSIKIFHKNIHKILDKKIECLKEEIDRINSLKKYSSKLNYVCLPTLEKIKGGETFFSKDALRLKIKILESKKFQYTLIDTTLKKELKSVVTEFSSKNLLLPVSFYLGDVFFNFQFYHEYFAASLKKEIPKIVSFAINKNIPEDYFFYSKDVYVDKSFLNFKNSSDEIISIHYE